MPIVPPFGQEIGRFYSHNRERQDRLTFLSYLPPNDFFNELLASYPNTVVAIGSNLLKKLTFNQQLEIFATHKPLAQMILAHKKFLHALNAEYLACLGRHSDEIADYILKNLRYFNQLSAEERDQLKQNGFGVQASGHAELPSMEQIEETLNDPSSHEELDIATLETWGKHDPILAEHIFEIDELEAKMSRFNLHAYDVVRSNAKISKSFHKICWASTHSVSGNSDKRIKKK